MLSLIANTVGKPLMLLDPPTADGSRPCARFTPSHLKPQDALLLCEALPGKDRATLLLHALRGRPPPGPSQERSAEWTHHFVTRAQSQD